MATASTSSPPVEVCRSILGYGKDALLSSLLVLNSALAAIDVRKNYQADNLLAGFEFFVWCTKQNRLLLEGLAIPALKLKAGVPPTWSESHDALAIREESLLVMIRAFAAKKIATKMTPSELEAQVEVRRSLLTQINQLLPLLDLDLRNALTEENTVVLKPLGLLLSPKEVQDLERRVLSAWRPADKAKLLPWLLHAQSPIEESRLLVLLPYTQRFSYRRTWVPAWRMHIDAALVSIFDRTVLPPQDVPSVGFFCSC